MTGESQIFKSLSKRSKGTISHGHKGKCEINGIRDVNTSYSLSINMSSWCMDSKKAFSVS